MSLVTAIIAMGLAVQAPSSAISPQQFIDLNAEAKRAVLDEISTSKSQLPIGLVIELVRAAAEDEAPDVRIAAMAAVSGRSMAARRAGTTGPRSDRASLRGGVLKTCLMLVRSDADDRVRHAALLAAGRLELPQNPSRQAMREEFVSLLIDVFRSDPSDRMRSEVVKTLRLSVNNSERIQNVLRDALIDPAASVRAAAAIRRSPP